MLLEYGIKLNEWKCVIYSVSVINYNVKKLSIEIEVVNDAAFRGLEFSGYCLTEKDIKHTSRFFKLRKVKWRALFKDLYVGVTVTQK